MLRFSVLAANSCAMLILTAGLLLPKPGAVDARVETSVRLHDLSLLQLANDRLMEEDELVLDQLHPMLHFIVQEARIPNGSTHAAL